MTLAAFIERSKREKEGWRYTDLEALLASKKTVIPAKAGIPLGSAAENSSARLLFKNGVFQPKLSTFGSVPSCILMGDLASGYSLTLGEKTCLVSQPIELVFETDQESSEEIPLKFSIDIGDNGRLTLLENYRPTPIPVTVDMDVTLRPRAKLVHGKIAAGGPHLALHKVRAQTGCYYSNFSLLRGSAPARHELDVALEGEESQTSLNGIMLLRGHDHADITARVAHKAPRCTSRQNYRSVLDDASRGVFQGKIAVSPGAQKTDSYQLSRALLLSDKAEMDAKPELEIYADDVKCSHGSSIGDLDENAMFYLRSRGLNEKEAQAVLVEGFISEMLDALQPNEWREIFRREIEAWHDL
ncbi:MAG: Fe-S cluster assembly protein SufD [Alphaproteobacteria bacterium]|nr:Fe-S cluster assembly protein SufD [Alphaproteobacteria bacterium]